MAAGIAHEINNPLGIILANTDVAKEESSDPMMRHLLETIQRNVERAAATTKRLLNIAMPQTICLTPQNAADIVRDALSFLRPQMKEVQANPFRACRKTCPCAAIASCSNRSASICFSTH